MDSLPAICKLKTVSIQYTIEGSLEITKDKEGLEAALKLKRAVDAAIDALKRDRNLPDSIENKTN
ncbi:hypothetical protein [Sulfuricurvum sp.]|uniref:hypothetical protein n=1 Tax=Sulfuricurvum sp. TaxID=2025608 RepID=UPI0026368769|nr:hypothetical protein [Sulfuricurvum sp.]MDD2267689.1 hypothetical protein [Sulfuricurvum sp.]